MQVKAAQRNIILSHIQIGVATLVATLLMLLHSPANAADSALKAQFEQSFQVMLKDPSNIDATLKYAELAVKLNDYEAAIPAYERILMYNPELSRIKLQLGKMYYHLQSPEMAKTYLRRAVLSAHSSAEVKREADAYLRRL